MFGRARSVRSVVAATLVAVLVTASPVTASEEVAKFPPGFLWGVSTSGFQSEGSFPDSNWTRYAENQEPYRNSVDFRNRYPGDIELARNLGVNVFRTSLEWARIEPQRGVRDETELAYYDDLVRRIRAAGMRPMLTLDHWVHPGWVADQGAWTNPRTVSDWLAHARFVVERYRSQDVIWITFNEASQYIIQETRHRPMGPLSILAMRQHLIKAHRDAYDLIHQVDPGAPVSSNIAYGSIFNGAFDAALFNEVTDKIDFIGIDYYYGASLQNWTAIHAATGEYWKIDPEPEGIYYVLKNYQRRLPDLPVYIVENGMPTDNGNPRQDGYTRSDHLRDHLYWVQRAIGEGVKVMGYNYWSLTDNYEWGSYRPRFGLYTVDAASDPSLTRRPTDAVPAYRSVISNSGVPGGYTPVWRPAWCSVEDLLASCLATPPTPPAPYQRPY